MRNNESNSKRKTEECRELTLSKGKEAPQAEQLEDIQMHGESDTFPDSVAQTHLKDI